MKIINNQVADILKLSQQDAELLIRQLSKSAKVHKKLQQAAQRYTHKTHAN